MVPARGEDLPERFRGPEGISIPLGHAPTPAEFAQHITAATGLGVAFLGRGQAGGDARFLGRAIGAVALGSQGTWTGALPLLLDEWTGELGYSWRYDAKRGVIEVVREMSAVFELHALGGTQRYQVTSSTAGGAASSGETQTADFSNQRLDTGFDYDPWPEIETAVKGLVSKSSTAEVLSAQASVVVRGLPGDVARVRAYLKHLNGTVLRPILVTVRVLAVSREKGSDFETDFSGALRTIAGGSYDFVFEAGRSGRSVGIVRPGAADLANSLELTLRALRSIGTVSRVLAAGVPALNGAPAQYYELLRHTYLAEVSTRVSDGGVETELRPGSISSGFSMSYVGRITAPREVLLRIFASLQDQPTFEVFGSGGNAIQLPEFRSRGISVTQAVREGETLVLSGFTDRVVSSDEEGFVRARNRLAGGTVHSDRQIDQVLLVTARIGDPASMSEVSEVVL